MSVPVQHDRLNVRAHLSAQLTDANLITGAAGADAEHADLSAADLAVLREHTDVARAHLVEARGILMRALLTGSDA